MPLQEPLTLCMLLRMQGHDDGAVYVPLCFPYPRLYHCGPWPSLLGHLKPLPSHTCVHLQATERLVPPPKCRDTMKSPGLDAELMTPLGLASHNVIRDIMFMALGIKCLRQAGIFARYLLDRCARLVSLDKLA